MVDSEDKRQSGRSTTDEKGVSTMEPSRREASEREKQGQRKGKQFSWVKRKADKNKQDPRR